MSGEWFEQLLDSASLGRLSRRNLLSALIASSAAGLIGSPAVEAAILAGENQAARRQALSRAYDYIVVGGGSAGCVVAARLAEDPTATVLLVEAGGDDRGVASISDPKVWFTNIGSARDWNMLYAPTPRLDNRDVLISRGKVLGGCGSINAMLWVRGHPSDYDRWEAQGATGWNFATSLPYFKAMENWQGGATALRGAGGPINVMQSDRPHPISAALLDASQTLGYPVRDDVNGPEFGGASLANLNVRGGARDSTSRAYLRPRMAQPNLTVLTGSDVLRINLDKAGRCTGIVHRVDGQVVETRATRELVLSAGSIATPKLLMLSGIGPSAMLREVAIPVRLDHPGIGQNLHDHPLMMGVNFSYLNAPAPLCDNGGGAQLLAASAPSLPVPDLMIVTIQVPYASAELAKRFGKIDSGFAVTPGLMRVESRGSLRLRSADPSAPPLINPNLLSTDGDMAAMMRGVEICQELGAQPAYRAIGRPAMPDRKLERSELAAFVRAGCATFFHPVGTCRMGSDQHAVVDPTTLKLRGVDGLRIIDASVMPEIPTANTQVATILIAERGAEMIRHAHART